MSDGRSEYNEILNIAPAAFSAADFLGKSSAYKDMFDIPFNKLNETNQRKREAIMDAKSLPDLEKLFTGISHLRGMTAENLFVRTSYLFGRLGKPDNQFEYFFIQLRDELDAYKVAGSRRSLLERK